MNLLALPAFTDNYIWMLHDGRDAIVVDPGEAAPVIAALDEHQLALAAILVTHHHGDHTGGISGLRTRLRGPLIGPLHDQVPAPCVRVADGARLDILSTRMDVIAVPGHTLDHLAYVAYPADAEPILFCGDTLFSGGCGRLFEGTPTQMDSSLQRLAALPGETRVCCAHEYTLSNLRFAHEIEPDNAALKAYTDWCQAERLHGRPTLPSTIARERQINPFLRCSEATVVRSVSAHGAAHDSPTAVLGSLRQWKNEYR